jgi:hypothetical protein
MEGEKKIVLARGDIRERGFRDGKGGRKEAHSSGTLLIQETSSHYHLFQV